MKNNLKILSCLKKSSILIITFVIITNIYSGVNFIFPWIYRYVYENYIPTLNNKIFRIILLTIISIILIRLITTFIKQIIESKMKIKFINIMRINLLHSLMQFEYSYFKEKTGGEIVSNLIPEIEVISDVIINILKCLIYFLQFFIFFMILFYIDKSIFLVLLITFFIAAGISIFFVKNISRSSYKLSKIGEKFYSFYYFIFYSIRDIKSYNLYNYQNSELKNLSAQNRKLYIQKSFYLTFLDITTALVLSIGIIIVSIICFYKIKSGHYSFGMFLTIMLFSGILINPMTELFKSLTIIQNGWISIKKIKSAFKYKKESETGIKIGKVKNSIETSNLSFSYDNKNYLLKKINFKLYKNSFLTIIGETGSGKSTIVNLLLKLYKLPDSKINIDKNDLNHIQIKNIRERIRIMSQDGFILNDTLRNNIDLDQSLCDDEIKKLCREVELSELLKKLPQDINSKISENGKNISGGEKQKILLARCLAKKSNVIILDEATSSLDIKTEEKLISILLKWKNKKQNKFIIAITHRPSFSKHSDYICILDNGEIIESGTHTELLKLKRRYYSFYTNRNIKKNEK